MHFINIDKHLARNSDSINLTLTNFDKFGYENLQIDIYKIGVLNNSFKFGTGANTTDRVKFVIDLSCFENAYYEVARIILRNESGEKKILVSNEDYQRTVFQVTDNKSLSGSSNDVITRIKILETSISELFNRPIDLSENKEDTKEYAVFVFIENLLITTQMRFKNFELLPSKDVFYENDKDSYIERFLEKNVNIKVKLDRKSSIPTCVIRYPAITSDNHEKVKEHCIHDVELIVQTLSLTRDSGGKVFSIVLIEKNTNKLFTYSIDNSYKGNLLGGFISGESPDTIEQYYTTIKDNTFISFLLSLYKDAQNEKSHDYKYVRLWQILETLAESKNYIETDILKDKNGNNILDRGGNIIKVQSGNAIVYNLIKSIEFANWENVNIWLSFRNAVAHHGSIKRYNELNNNKDLYWGEIGFNKIEENEGYDICMQNLKDTVKNILIKEITI